SLGEPVYSSVLDLDIPYVRFPLFIPPARSFPPYTAVFRYVSVEIPCSHEHQTAVPIYNLGTYGRPVECKGKCWPPRADAYLFNAFGKQFGIKNERLGRTLVNNGRNADIFLANQLFKFINGKKQALRFGTRYGV